MVSELEKHKEERDFWKKEFEKAEIRAKKTKELDAWFKFEVDLLERDADYLRQFVHKGNNFEKFEKNRKLFNKLVSENEEAKKNCKKG